MSAELGDERMVLRRGVATVPLSESQLTWLHRAENWGLWLMFPEAGETSFVPAYMWRGSNGKVRFFEPGPALGGRRLQQVGPECPNVVAAIYWAFAQQWRDPELSPSLNVRCQVEVQCGGAPERAH